jgi:tRNA pseudouridine32 synthase/23S rRNA pseudouridine746 synthase
VQAPLPVIDGVGPSAIWLPVGNWKTILAFLENRFPGIEPSVWSARMEQGLVVDETGQRLDQLTPYRVGACVFYYRDLPSEQTIPFDAPVLYRDQHILVVDKPHFLPVMPAGRFLKETLLARLRRGGLPDSLVPVHRLDRETAGLVIFSLKPKSRGHYAALFRNREVIKVYEAIAWINPTLKLPFTYRSRIVPGEPFFRMQEIDGAVNSETRIELLRKIGDQGCYQLTPITGKKHQLRVHMSALGAPIVNDRLYPTVIRSGDDFTKPLKLLARSMSFRDPLTGQEHRFESSRQL